MNRHLNLRVVEWNAANERVQMFDGNVSLSARECDITVLLRASMRLKMHIRGDAISRDAQASRMRLAIFCRALRLVIGSLLTKRKSSSSPRLE